MRVAALSGVKNRTNTRFQTRNGRDERRWGSTCRIAAGDWRRETAAGINDGSD
jgi:hypothetical protein